MVEVWRAFHDAAPALADSEPFLFDYVDVTRQVPGRACGPSGEPFRGPQSVGCPLALRPVGRVPLRVPRPSLCPAKRVRTFRGGAGRACL